MSLFDIKVLPSFTFITAGEFRHHCVVISSIVAGDMANLAGKHDKNVDAMTTGLTYLVYNPEAVADLEEGLAQSITIVRCVHARETEQCVFKRPLSRGALFDPVACDRKVTICIRCLPCITGQTNVPGDRPTLRRRVE
jgi:hypothetical protein